MGSYNEALSNSCTDHYMIGAAVAKAQASFVSADDWIAMA
jgi:hypothetical protein